MIGVGRRVVNRGSEIRYARHGGAHLAYRVRGSGPPLLWAPSQFIPISAMDEEPSYELFLEHLSQFATVIMFDRLGIGLSDPLVAEPTVDGWASQLESVMVAAGFESCWVVAHAMAGSAAVTLAATRPERVQGLVLALAAGSSNRPNDLALDDVVATARPSEQSSAVDFLAVLAPTRSEDAAFRAWWERAGREGASPFVAQKLLALHFSSDVSELQASVRVPTLVIDRPNVDRVLHGPILGSEIEGARVVEVEGIDILPWLPDSDAVVAEIEEFVTGRRSAPRGGRRRLLAVLFADVVGSTPAAVRLGDSRWRDVLETYYRLMRDEIGRAGGSEIATAGDGFVVTFDTPSSAVRCANRMHRALSTIGIGIRTGIHCGEIEVRRDGDVAGIAVHIAARVESLAHPGETWVTNTVKEAMAGTDVLFVNQGRHDLKGVPDQWQLFSIDVPG